MAGVKISALPAVGSALLTDIFPVVQAGVTSKETISQLVTLINNPAVLTGFLPLAGGTMTGSLILAHDPTLPLEAATKEYVDLFASGITVILSCEAGTTPAGGDLGGVYFNGVAGVGATITNAGAMVAFAVDGYSANLNDRILVKNQTNAFENGIYTVTTVGSGIANWVLTRATDYDQAPSEIKPGTLIAVNNGTVNATTSWLETATVTNIGIDPILFSQFTFGPTSFLLRANNLSDLLNVPAALVNLGLGVPTGTGNVVLQTSPTLITPILGVATATSLQFSPSTNGIIGTTTNNNAIAGRVGEFISSVIPNGSAVVLNPGGVPADITSIALTAGDWDVWGNTFFISAVDIHGVLGWSSATSATVPDQSLRSQFGGPTNTNIRTIGFNIPQFRYSLAINTTIYLSAFGETSTGAGLITCCGGIYARRVR